VILNRIQPPNQDIMTTLIAIQDSITSLDNRLTTLNTTISSLDDRLTTLDSTVVALSSNIAASDQRSIARGKNCVLFRYNDVIEPLQDPTGHVPTLFPTTILDLTKL
jgi:hypothetical protein